MLEAVQQGARKTQRRIVRGAEPLPTVSVKEITHGTDIFFCDIYSVKMSADACVSCHRVATEVLRQKDRWLSSKGVEQKAKNKCVDCKIGACIRTKLEDVARSGSVKRRLRVVP